MKDRKKGWMEEIKKEKKDGGKEGKKEGRKDHEKKNTSRRERKRRKKEGRVLFKVDYPSVGKHMNNVSSIDLLPLQTNGAIKPPDLT